MACAQGEFELHVSPSLCLCTVSQEAMNIDSKPKGHVHCPCEVCLGEPVYPTTAWRHIQRSKKAKFANEVQDEIDCCSLAEPESIETDETETFVNFEKDVAYTSGFHSENASAEFCNFAENESGTSSEISMGDNSDLDSMLSESSSNVDENDSESEREDEGTRGDDINKFVCHAILRAVEMKEKKFMLYPEF